MSTLERAIAIAAQSHAGRFDKGGAPYILHPLRVMLKQSSDDARIVAVLHDVIEDGGDRGWTLERIAHEGFAAPILAALEAVTKRSGEEYMQFAVRAAADPLGRMVKLADLIDNCDLSRIAEPTQADRDRIEKYRKAIELISSQGGELGEQAKAATSTVDEPDRLRIRYERFERGYRELDAYVDGSGALILDGCDAGEDVADWCGDWDYEYTLTVPADHRDHVLLHLVKEELLRGKNESVHAFKEWLAERGIPSKFSSY